MQTRKVSVLEQFVDAAMKISMFDMPWDDETVAEVNYNRREFKKAFKPLIKKYLCTADCKKREVKP